MFNIVLYQPKIPPNTGNIARLCVATTCRLHLIHPLGFDASDASAKRAGLDYWKFLELKHHDSWEHFLQNYPEASMYFFSKKSRVPYTKANFKKDDFLIFGAETTGLPDALFKKYPKQFFTIPMWGQTRSLNLATSVGIVTYEALRQVQNGF